MKKSVLILPRVWAIAAFANEESSFKYPDARKSDLVDDYHGTRVVDHYRLEDPDSAETKGDMERANRRRRSSMKSVISLGIPGEDAGNEDRDAIIRHALQAASE